MKGTVRFLVYSGLLLFTLFLLTTCRDVESVDPNRHPVAVAGPDVTATSGSSVTLDASKSSDPDGDSLSYEWLILTKPQASQATILHFDSVKGIFTPDVSGLYLIRLVVTDNIAVNADTIDINVIKANHPPVANAGPDGKVNVGASYNLTGSGTDPDGDTLTYSWTLPQKPAGSNSTIKSPTKAETSFVADKAGSYLAILTVSDGKLTDADSVLVTTTTNHPPLVDAGKDQQLPAGSSVALNGSATDADQDPLTFYWSFGPLPKGSTAAFKDASKPQTSFTADKEGSYTVILTANDGNFSVNDTLVVTATHVNQPPVANAGPDGKSDLNTPYILSGSGTDPENSPLTYSWTLVNKPAGSTASIKSPTSASTSLVPDKPGSYTATLIVSDGSLPSAPDQVVITTNPVDVTTINPTSGPENIMVTISGKNFSNVAAENIVKFNGVTAVVTSAGYTSLDVTVPKGAGTGIVSVTVNGVTDNGPIFTYILTGVVATLAQFNSPYGLASDPSGNIYIADYNSNLIRKMAPNGTLTTIAGDGTAGYFDSKLPQSKFNHPAGLVYDASHNSLYVCDRDNQCIRKVDLTLGIVTTVLGFPQAGFADGKKPTAQFNSPIGIARDAAGNLYIGDAGNHRIRKIVGDTIVSTFSGNGTAGLADGSAKATKFNAPSHLTIDATNFLYVADALNHAIRKVDTNGNSTTIAGNGTSGFVSANGTNARFNLPFGISIDGSKNLYVSDFNNHSIRKVTPAGDVTTVAGNGTSGYAEGAGSTARFNQPCGVVFTSNFVYVADFINQRVRRIQFE